MRRAAKIDDNQPEIVAGLRKIGCTVQSLAAVGEGCPDCLVGYRGHNFLMEIKDGSKPPSRQGLTPDQTKWHSDWRGDIRTVKNLDEAIMLVTQAGGSKEDLERAVHMVLSAGLSTGHAETYSDLMSEVLEQIK